MTEKLPYEVAEENAINAFKEKRISAEIWKNQERSINIDFWYPNVDNNINEIKIGLMHVRASDGIKIHYDFERDGYVIMQPYTIEVKKDTHIDCEEHWEEVGFFRSWALEDKNVELN